MSIKDHLIQLTMWWQGAQKFEMTGRGGRPPPLPPRQFCHCLQAATRRRRLLDSGLYRFQKFQQVCLYQFGEHGMYAPSGLTRGARGDICPRAQNFGDAKLRSECYILITKCQRMLIITIYKMWNVIAKSHQDHQSEQLWTLVTFHGWVSVSNNKPSLVVWLTVASQRFQKARVANFHIIS